MTHTTTVHPLDTGSPSGVSKHNQGKDLPEEGNTTLTRDLPRLNFHRSRDSTGSSAGGSTSAWLPKPGSNALILRSKLQAQRSSQRAHSSCEDEEEEEEEEVAQLCLTLCDPMDCSLPGSFSPWNFPGKSTGVGCHCLLQGIFPNQGSNLGLLHCRQTLYHLSCRKVQS